MTESTEAATIEAIAADQAAPCPIDSDVIEGDVIEGDVIDGDVIEGDVIEGDVIDGDVIDGDVIDSDVIDSEPKEDDAADETAIDPQAEIARYRDLHLRAVAELENARKRFRRDTDDQRAFATASVLRDVLSVLDNLDMSLLAAKQGANDPDALLQGVAMIRDQLEKVVVDRGAVRIVTEGKRFDPNIHEAISAIPMEGKDSNVVIQEIRRGYKIKDRVLRAAQVVVTK